MTFIGAVTCLVLSQSATFFPLDETKGISSFEEAWYGKALRAMEERPLHSSASTTKGTVYRLTVLPTWGNPVTVRLGVVDGKATIDGKRLDGHGGYEPGRLVEKGSAALSPEALAAFDQLFTTLEFDKLPTRDPTNGRDGTQYLLERVAGGKHQVVVRWSPEIDSAKRGLTTFHAVARWLYRASPLKGDLMHKGRVELRKAG